MTTTPWNEENINLFSNFLKEKNYSKIFILVDENTHEKCFPLIIPDIATDIPIEILEIEPGESQKVIETYYQLALSLTDLEADRSSLLICLGGGVITDLGGFLASTYLRGIDFIYFPTTLLAMIDAAIGGKNGIDTQFHKNRLGTFSKAKKIYIYPDFLKTLEDNELKSGFAEMLKHGLISNYNLFEELIKFDSINVENVIPYLEESIAIKENIVALDPNEMDLRKTLNFGHTIGHAVESLYLQNNKNMTHGEAVAIGMFFELKLSEKLNFLDPKKTNFAIEGIKKFYTIPSFSSYEIDTLMGFMKKDKKNKNGKILFSLLTDLGKANYNIEITEDQIKKILTTH